MPKVTPNIKYTYVKIELSLDVDVLHMGRHL